MHARPRLQPHVRVYPQSFRGTRWTLLHNTATQQTLRVNEAAYQWLALMDGHFSVTELIEVSRNRLGADAPAADDLAALVVQLASARFIIDGLPAEFHDALHRRFQVERPWWQHPVLHPTVVRVPLFDPSRWLTRVDGVSRRIFSPTGLTLWLALLVVGALTAIGAADAISAGLNPDILEPAFVLGFTAVFIIVKALHELAHALALKAWGGTVREVGLLFMWFFPCPYVDASESALLADPRKRAIVAAAGILTELLLAAIALFVWLAAEPGLVDTIAFQVMLVGGVSSVLMNGNPLMKFDAYYVVEDLLQIPNLATRANRYWMYALQKHLLGSTSVRNPVTAPGERRWFIVYAPLALVWRLVLLSTIALLFAQAWLFIGITIAILTIGMQVVAPLLRGAHFLLTSATLATCRRRAIAVPATGIVLLASLLAGVPMTATTDTEGVVWTSEQGSVFVATDGFVARLLAAPDSHVQMGAPLISLENPELSVRRERLKLQRQGAELERLQALSRSRVEFMALADTLRAIDEELRQIDTHWAGLTVTSPVTGTFMPVQGDRLQGRYLRKGELIGYVLPDSPRVIKVVVGQDDIGLIRAGVTRARVRLAERPWMEYRTGEIRQTPAAQSTLPSRALGVAGGGEIPIDAKDINGLTPAEPVFTLELPLPADVRAHGVGGRAFVRLDHDRRPLAAQVARQLRQVFLTQLGI